MAFTPTARSGTDPLTVPSRAPVMDRSPILFRCDANAERGWEAFYQCLTYAAALQRRRRPAYFLGRIEPFPLLSQIVRGGNDYLSAGFPVGTAEDCDETIREVRRLNAAAVIVNAPGVQEEYLRELSSTGTTVVVIDSESASSISQSAGDQPAHRPAAQHLQVGAGRPDAVGPEVRDRTLGVSPPVRSADADPQGSHRGIIAFGEDDFAGQSLQRAQELLAASRVEKLSVLVRSHHHQLEQLRKVAEKNKGRLEVLTEPSELGTRLPRADFRTAHRATACRSKWHALACRSSSFRRMHGTSRTPAKWTKTAPRPIWERPSR